MADQPDPAAVPDDPATPLDVRAGLDTDGDERPDTVLTRTVAELLIHTDLDGDGFADRVLGIGPDGTVRDAGSPLPEYAIVWEP